ncbi:hypothetical protein HMPREF3216_00351 [Gardnerella vaginalis]|uniref:Uncharacterized protein n=1 Tax=Gardnerella vaginalis TaxID=2702 RepID=A0A133NQY7_GARVA|nr:hypothetical protein HMPREF3216_00351 [Gardnerella vaginalis]
MLYATYSNATYSNAIYASFPINQILRNISIYSYIYHFNDFLFNFTYFFLFN